MENKLKKILIVGAGPSGIGQECELDSAAFQALHVWKRLGIETFLLDNNPYSVILQEMNADHVYIKPVNTDNAKHVIESEHVDAITSVFGGVNALKVIQRLNKNGILEENNVDIIGLNKDNIDLFNNENRLNQRLKEYGIPTPDYYIVSNFDELRNVIDKISFPISVRPLDPKTRQQRSIFQNMEQVTNEADNIFDESKSGKCLIEREIVGYKEIGTVSLRDTMGTKMMISSLEDMNPVGVNSNDSVVFTPSQTLSDTQIQMIRSISFEIMDVLGIKGVCHVQFALNAETDDCFVLKVNPSFNMSTTLAARSTGYPVALVTSQLLLNYPIMKVKLPERFHKFTSILQPISDHITVKIPIWPFEQLPEADARLGTKTKSIGSVIGVGRSCEAALLKGIRSSQSSPKDVLPSYSELSEDELISQLIHPTDIQLPILFEALSRHYTVEDLHELTKIDRFFFIVMANIDQSRSYILQHQNDPKAFRLAHEMGFGDGMLSSIWHINIDKLRRKDSYKTYKMIEPTAGEFPEQINSFYASYEIDNESNQIGNKTALVIGKGRNKIGPNVASDFYTSELLIQLKKIGFNTVILNNNPNSASLAPMMSDKQYIEPIQLGEILDVIQTEKPKYVFLPGNRHFLIRELSKYAEINLVILPPNQKNAVWYGSHVDFAFDLLVTDDQIIPISTVGFKSEDGSDDINLQTDYYVPYGKDALNIDSLVQKAKVAVKNQNIHGLVQVLFYKDQDQIKITGVRPLRITETVLLNMSTGINWIGVLIRMATGHLNIEKIKKEVPKIDSSTHFTVMQASFPFKQLGVYDYKKDRSLESGAKLSIGYTINEATKKLLK